MTNDQWPVKKSAIAVLSRQKLISRQEAVAVAVTGKGNKGYKGIWDIGKNIKNQILKIKIINSL